MKKLKVGKVRVTERRKRKRKRKGRREREREGGYKVGRFGYWRFERVYERKRRCSYNLGGIDLFLLYK